MPLNLIRSMSDVDVDIMAEPFCALGWPGKTAELYRRYLAEQRAGERLVLLGERRGEFAGYVTVRWTSQYPPFRSDGIPEIQDLNVLAPLRGLGMGNALLDAAESAIKVRSPIAGLGVGLYVDYGAAQRIYVRRGYVPDGRGIMYDGHPVQPGSTIRIDDEATLMMTKSLV